jgi:hypothetical protein
MALMDVSQYVYLTPPMPELRLSPREVAAIRALELRVEPDASRARVPLWRRILHWPPPLPFE